MKVMFLDESGDHSLDKIDPQYPVFVLGGVIMDMAYASGTLTEAVKQFKLELFGRDDILLHTMDITRNRNGFERMKEPEFRALFYSTLNDLMSKLEYQVVACAIRKDWHLERYGVSALDPYMLSLDILVERFCMDIGSVDRGGTIIAEKRGRIFDREIELAWEHLKLQGTYYMKGSVINRRIDGIQLRDKTQDLAGLEIADLVVSPIGRFVIGKSTKEDFRIIEAKFRTDRAGKYMGTGLVVLPK